MAPTPVEMSDLDFEMSSRFFFRRKNDFLSNREIVKTRRYGRRQIVKSCTRKRLCERADLNDCEQGI